MSYKCSQYPYYVPYMGDYSVKTFCFQYYFNTKRYVALNFQSEYAASLIHVAIYRKNADEQIRNIIAMIRREMHIQ